MSLFGNRWEPDGLDALSPAVRLILSVVVSGVMGFLLEYVGIEVFKAFSNANPATIYAATAIWAFGLGPLLVALRKASIFVPMLIVGLAFAILVLFNHYYFIEWAFVNGTFQDTGRLWSPRIWEFREGAIFGLRHPLLIALAAGAVETLVVPASLWTQKLLTLKLRRKRPISLDEEASFFGGSVVPVAEMKPRRDFGFIVMRGIFLAYGVYFFYQIVGLTVNGKGLPVVGMFFISPPETLNTIMKLTLMLSLATVGAFNAGVRREAAILLTIGHLISVGASLGLYFAYPLNPVFPNDQSFLLASVIGDGVLVILLVYLIFDPGSKKPDLSGLEDVELRSPASTLLRTFFLLFGILFTIFTLAIVYFRVFGSPESALGAVFGGPDPLVSNSLTKYGTLAALGYFLFARPSMRRYFMPTLIIAFSVSIVATFIYGLQGSTSLITRLGTVVTIPWFMVQHIIVDGGGLAMILMLRRLHYHVDYQVTSLRPSSAECVMALHEAARETDQHAKLSSRDVLQRIDEHIAGIRGRRRGLLGFPFWLVEHVFTVLTGFRPPFSTMSRDEQRWMLRRYMLRPHYERVKAAIPQLADLMYQVGEIVHSLVTLAFFSSAPAHEQVGYVLPDARERLQSDIASARPPEGAGERTLPANAQDPLWRRPVSDPSLAAQLLAPRVGLPGKLYPTPDDSPPVAGEFSPIPDEVDYCIIGSGAAGAVLAYRLAVQKGNDNSICVIERGGYFSPRQDFSDDEMRMIRMLYTEGGLQFSRTFDFSILQGECVGGTTVINNAVCVQMPDVSRREWAGVGIDLDLLDKHYDLVRQEINIDVVKPTVVNQDVEALFTSGVNNYNLAHKGPDLISPVRRLHGNFGNCLGCGLCNIGCRRMRKLSTLETYIPWARAHGVSVLSSMGAVQCETEARGAKKRVKSVIIRKPNGEFQKIGIRKALILSAGAIASSRFLMRSNLGGDNAGRRMSCNFALPPLVEFDQSINAYDGLQMALFAAPDSYDAIFETTFNPPGTYSIASPLHFDRHARMMRAYRRSVNFTALVGSDPVGEVSRKRDLAFGRAVEWQQTESDLRRIKKALVTIIEIAKAAGARRIILPTHPPLNLSLDSITDQTIESFDRIINDRRYINFVTAHPQGGNLMASDDFEERVVELDFSVRDCENLFVCDASIFPRGIRVNPQWTVMAMASMAGDRIGQVT